MKEVKEEIIFYCDLNGYKHTTKYECLTSIVRSIFNTTNSDYTDTDFIDGFVRGILYDKKFKEKVNKALKEVR